MPTDVVLFPQHNDAKEGLFFFIRTCQGIIMPTGLVLSPQHNNAKRDLPLFVLVSGA